MSRRVYLDNAATSWPKLPEAVAAATDFIHNCGATTGRGGYASARVADEWLTRTRRNIARLIDAPRPNHIAICSSGTHALNAALFGLLKSGDHVLTTGIEHNSVLRPLESLRKSGVEYDVVPLSSDGRVYPSEDSSLVRPNTRMVALGHASNVTGAATDLKAWSEFAEQHGLILLVDASQTLGYLPISVRDLKIDVLAAAGHKGLGGLAGTGLLYVQPELQTQMIPLQFGGTGRASEQLDAPGDWPLCIEVGNLNLPGAVSMAVSAEKLADEESLSQCWWPVFAHLVEGLRNIDAVSVLGPAATYDISISCDLVDWVPVVSIHVDGWDVHDLAMILDEQFQVEVRAGLHCAALVHNFLSDGSTTGQVPTGTLRMSTGRYTDRNDVDIALDALQTITG